VTIDPRLLGTWTRIHYDDDGGLEISVTFEEDGSLIWTMEADGRKEEIAMPYTIEGDAILSQQRSRYRFDGEILVVIFNDEEFRYTRRFE